MKPSLLWKLKHISFLLILASGCRQPQNDDVNYDVGFTVFQTTDRSRIYKPETDSTDYLHYRPLDIDVWYPASPTTGDSAMVFSDILELLEKRANYYTASHVGDGLTQQIAQYLCDGAKCSDPKRLLSFRSRSFKNAPSIKNKFPLIVYLSSYNGMGHENFRLFEEWVRRGFVVVSINSIGRYPGDMTMKREDLQEQVDDAVVSLTHLDQNENIDFSKIGIVGYSWGGLSASLLASRIENVDCLISLDGSEFHHYGEVKDEDNDFEGIRNSEDFKKMKLSIPYLRLESSNSNNPDAKDSVYNFSEKLSKDILILKVDSAGHEDFSCLPTVVRASGKCSDNKRFETITKMTIGFLEEHLKGSTSFSETIKQEMNRTVRKK